MEFYFLIFECQQFSNVDGNHLLELYKQLGIPLEDKQVPNNVRDVEPLLGVVRRKEGTSNNINEELSF